ncbi:MAG: tRNA (adenosine(37)-N6)-threonylcarbamoyltransferase complex ATPase subunit type 1 TsaE [Gemmatimonadetes bacterium]|jgi:tRNA threonylcarbamoyladenosine biosynthesis protein TsaE|nr:tRNA (adenosine(37)-N6)-threonylcarbamoyltransferase complex ATPase subunit type 1 TsaE [Gemmatimonadota bacterium]MBT5965312.1 tRNA (adenosine(37)-N6)-threonylcarbamoyltransferase complex ATPase subunit type 1 TsaE [Gemmatimonadota bacterium]MBT7455016.1 tRNA (adenosine(37)-N6)-threonylcarbamoyltransferase complex ATPase subunit type 1 TsaE [Gemmatimonadota bacterium]
MSSVRQIPFDRELSSSPEQTQALGRELASHLLPGDLVALEGELGSGKTCLIQGLCAALGVTSRVNSPSFVLINEYSGKDSRDDELLIRHFDLYRLNGPEELDDIGAREFFHDPTGICLVEWADRVPGLLPPAHWYVEMSHMDDPAIRQVLCRRIETTASLAGTRGSNL